MREKVAAHFRAYFGVEESIITSTDVDVMIWADPTDPRAVMLTTVGMSSVPMSVGDHCCVSRDPRVELLMHSLRSDGALAAQLLSDLSRYPAEHDTFLHWSHVVSLGRPVTPNSRLTALYFSFPAIESSTFATMHFEGKRVDVLWVVPITEEEKRVFQSSGADALEELLESKKAEVGDLRRS